METRRKIIKTAIFSSLVVAILLLSGGYLWLKIADRKQRDNILASIPPPPQDTSMEPIVVSALNKAYQQITASGDAVASLGALAKTYQANGLLNEAIQTIDLLLRLDPGNPHWPHLLAFILAGYGELEVAIPLWERTIALDPEYMPAHLRRGEAFLKLNRMDDAKDAFLLVLIKDTSNPHAFHGLARVAIGKGDYEAAHDYLAKSMAYSDGSVGIQLMVTVLERLGRTSKANSFRGMAKTLESYSDIPDPWIHELMDYCYDPYQLVSGGGFAVYAGDIPRAVELMKRAILYDPDNASAHYQLGMVYEQGGMPEQSIASYQRASDLNPQLSDAWLKRANLYLKSGHVEEGDRLLALGLANNPNSPALHLLYGERLYEKKRYMEATAALKRSIELRPQEPEAYIMLARVYLDQNAFIKARDIVQESLVAEAANPMGLSMMVIISISLKDEKSAQKWLHEVDAQPRINANDRNDLRSYFEQAFGRKPQ